MDVLADVLAAAGISASARRVELASPWRLAFPAGGGAVFVSVLRGSCTLEVERREAPLRLEADDSALLPRGLAYTLADPKGGAPRGRSASAGAGRPVPALLEVTWGLDAEGARPLVSLLPPLIHVPNDELLLVPSLASTLRLLVDEVSGGGPGAALVASRLAEALLVQLIRWWADGHPNEARGWLGALRDGRILAAVSRMHAEPGRALTVPVLAREAGLSRAAFAERFTQLVGEPPHEHLRLWRLHVAAGLLRGTEAPVSEVAGKAGYRSESAFARAFRKERGMAPTDYRRARRAPPGVPPREDG